jgi:hypothetical protein
MDAEGWHYDAHGWLTAQAIDGVEPGFTAALLPPVEPRISTPGDGGGPGFLARFFIPNPKARPCSLSLWHTTPD